MGSIRLLPVALAALAAALAAAPATAQAAPTVRLMAPASACPDQHRSNAPRAAQEEAVRCLVNFARRQRGLGPLDGAPSLRRSARSKASDILRCKSFSHSACGRSFTYWMKRTGYLHRRCWRAGENLAWGSGARATPRSIFRAWLRSPRHRANILGDFAELGVGLRVGSLRDRPGVHVWTQHFGSRCSAG